MTNSAVRVELFLYRAHLCAMHLVQGQGEGLGRDQSGAEMIYRRGMQSFRTNKYSVLAIFRQRAHAVTVDLTLRETGSIDAEAFLTERASKEEMTSHECMAGRRVDPGPAEGSARREAPELFDFPVSGHLL
jgi:hypothetical protein